MRRTAIILGIALLAGCDKPQASVPTTRPTTASVLATPATPDTDTTVEAPVDDQSQPLCTITIDGRPVAFPQAKLVVIRHPNGLQGIFCSDDPKNAIDHGYEGNSFAFATRLRVDNIKDIPLVPWTFGQSNPGSVDDLTGIFLHGSRDRLVPSDQVRITFQNAQDGLLVYLSGTFMHTNPDDPMGPPVPVQINACLHTGPAEMQ